MSFDEEAETAGCDEEKIQKESLTSTGSKERKANSRAIGFYIYAFVACSVASGVVYGWPSLRRQLVSVDDSELDEKTLGVIFTVGSWSTQAGRIFYGLARDRCLGTKLTTTLALCLTMLGSLGVAFSSANNAIALSISMFFIGTGSGVQLAMQPVAGLFDSTIQGSVLASFSGAFHIAGLMFVILTAATTNRRLAFVSFSGVVLILAVVAMWILPRRQFVNDDEQNESKREESHGHEEDITVPIKLDVIQDQTGESDLAMNMNHVSKNEGPSSPVEGDDIEVNLHSNTEEANQQVYIRGETDASTASQEAAVDKKNKISPTVYEQLLSMEYILLLVWFSVLLIPMQYYIAIIGFILENRGDDDGNYTRIFNIVYASAAIASPVLGKVADIIGLGISQGFATVTCAASLILLAFDMSLNAHLLGMIVYGLGRITVYSYYFTNIGKRFGYSNYGTLAGTGLFTSGVVSLLQYPLIAATTDGYGFEVNLGCGFGSLCLLPYCIWLANRERNPATS